MKTHVSPVTGVLVDSRQLRCLLLHPIVALLAAAWVAVAAPLPDAIQSIVDRDDYQRSTWGLLVQDVTTGEILAELNAGKLFAPASVTKLFSCAAAWIELGPDHRFETRVVRRGEVSSDGVLDGELVLIGSGDPTLGGRTTTDGRLAWANVDHIYADGNGCHELPGPDPLQGLNELARQTRASGIVRVRGRVRADDRLFEHSGGSGSGPQRVSPLVVNDHLIDFIVKAGNPGEPASVEVRPRSARFKVDARITTSASNVPPSITIRSDLPFEARVRGTIPAGSKPIVRIHEVADPQLWAEALFVEALQREGITVESVPEAAAAGASDDSAERTPQAALPVVGMLTSPPLRENLTLILKVSHNLHANMLPLLIASQHGERTLERGLRRQGGILAGLGLDRLDMSFADGAGGAQADRVTPRVAVALLRAMARRPDAVAFRAALPILGRDGTLADISAGTPAAGRVQAKTGTLQWVDTMNDGLMVTSKAMAGYVTTRSGRELAFAMFVNNVPRTRTQRAAVDGRTLGQIAEAIHDLY